jgi:hypothetical protein
MKSKQIALGGVLIVLANVIALLIVGLIFYNDSGEEPFMAFAGDTMTITFQTPTGAPIAGAVCYLSDSNSKTTNAAGKVYFTIQSTGGQPEAGCYCPGTNQLTKGQTYGTAITLTSDCSSSGDPGPDCADDYTVRSYTNGQAYYNQCDYPDEVCREGECVSEVTTTKATTRTTTSKAASTTQPSITPTTTPIPLPDPEEDNTSALVVGLLAAVAVFMVMGVGVLYLIKKTR